MLIIENDELKSISREEYLKRQYDEVIGLEEDIRQRDFWREMSFVKQMAELGGEIDFMLRHIERFDIKNKIQAAGKSKYGEQGSWTHTICILFERIKNDPKNINQIDILNTAETELLAYLFDEPGAPSTEDIKAFWDGYMWKYAEELGYEKEEDKNEG